MEINFNSWMALESAMQEGGKRVSRATVRRIIRFARPLRKAVFVLVALSTVTAVLAVATPLIAGRVVDGIVSREGSGVIVGLALVIAVIAVVDAGVGIIERWQSSRIGEDLILRLRQSVFDHVQRMPVAFFTRTRTGALVSRLNNDVIAAQRAFSMTLSTVVSNIIALMLTLAVMIALSWQITLLALIMLPVFYLPARRMGRRLAGLEREAAGHNAAMTTQIRGSFQSGATRHQLKPL